VHPLLTTLHDAGAGRFPEVDGGVTCLPALEDGQEAGRREMSVETTDHGPSGRELIEQALTMTPSGDPLFAAVAPGNARSLRSFLACGFVPLGSEVLILPRRAPSRDRAFVERRDGGSNL
jgi:hypothetical protein